MFYLVLFQIYENLIACHFCYFTYFLKHFTNISHLYLIMPISQIICHVIYCFFTLSITHLWPVSLWVWWSLRPPLLLILILGNSKALLLSFREDVHFLWPEVRGPHLKKKKKKFGLLFWSCLTIFISYYSITHSLIMFFVPPKLTPTPSSLHFTLHLLQYHSPIDWPDSYPFISQVFPQTLPL